jgi:ribosomal protein S18 acetylase RimI-like enzyme
MTTEFVKAALPQDLKRLVAFDHKVFRKADLFRKSDWPLYQTYWMCVSGVQVGCCAFQHDVDFDPNPDHDESPPLKGSLYIATSGIHPRFQGVGFGSLLKAWEIAYARYHGFHRLVTNHRPSNKRMIQLNKNYGFRIIRRPKAIYYEDPEEPTIVMERKLKR